MERVGVEPIGLSLLSVGAELSLVTNRLMLEEWSIKLKGDRLRALLSLECLLLNICCVWNNTVRFYTELV